MNAIVRRWRGWAAFRPSACTALSASVIMTLAGTARALTQVSVTSTSAGIGPTGCTLQEAVLAMNAGASQNGCTLSGTGTPRIVILGNNTYSVNDRVSPSVTMTIRGSFGSMGTTVIQPTSTFSANSVINLQTFSTNHHHLTLQDLTVRRTSGTASVSGVRVAGFWSGSSGDAGPIVYFYRVRVQGFNNSGVYSSYGNLEIEDSIIENNSSGNNGGGIRSFADGQSNRGITMFRSVVRNNAAVNGGGGIYFNGGGNSRIQHTTIAQNDAQNGGGLFAQTAPIGYLELNYVTIAQNDASNGGGIYCNNCDERVRVYASITADNTASSGGADLDGFLFSTSSIWSATDSRDEAIHDGDLFPLDPLLGPFMDLGGNVSDLDGDGVTDGMMGFAPMHDSAALDMVQPQPNFHLRDGRSFLRGRSSGVLGTTGFDDLGAYEQGPWEIERVPLRALGGTGTTHSILTDPLASDGRIGRLRGAGAGAFATYRIPVFEDGHYYVLARVRSGPSGAQAKLQWSNSAAGPWTDVSAVQELYTPLITFNELHLNSFIDLSPGVGQKYFRWYITGKHSSSTNHDVVTDYIKLVKQ